MADEDRQRRPDPDKSGPENSDPTGIGPPPPGAETQVKEGTGVTQGTDLGKGDRKEADGPSG
ncbi:hypothetical protein [Enterovirga aerilata]|uniref:Uncharacterized protein n=1 Tax=Enterovirga aerilata TaxID=2730920 RepID=A0A849I6X7_9HYPH|nr:hypothetical protein [Enterovirga sp. DB1703]NNM73041.1 hypothetical protein [Enterovirga sp. DB1703]